MLARDLAAHESWLAIRQPAVVRLLERELAGRDADADALAAGLMLAWRVLGETAPLRKVRLDHNALSSGLAAVRSGLCDRAMARSLRDQIEELPMVLTPLEQDAVATVIAAILWALLDVSVGARDALVA